MFRTHPYRKWIHVKGMRTPRVISGTPSICIERYVLFKIMEFIGYKGLEVCNKCSIQIEIIVIGHIKYGQASQKMSEGIMKMVM